MNPSLWVLRCLLYAAAVFIATAAFFVSIDLQKLRFEHVSGLLASATAVVIAAAIFVEDAVGRVSRREPLIHYWPIWAAFWLVMFASCALGCALIVAFVESGSRTQGLVAIYLGLIATTGWIVGHARSQDMERRKKTFDLLIKIRESSALTSRIETLIENFPSGRTIDAEGLERLGLKRAQDVRSAVVYVANYYEFIALAIRSGDLDELTMYDSYRLMILAFERKCAPVLGDIRAQNPDRGTRAYEGLYWLVRKFESRGGRPDLGTPAEKPAP